MILEVAWLQKTAVSTKKGEILFIYFLTHSLNLLLQLLASQDAQLL